MKKLIRVTEKTHGHEAKNPDGDTRQPLVIETKVAGTGNPAKRVSHLLSRPGLSYPIPCLAQLPRPAALVYPTPTLVRRP